MWSLFPGGLLVQGRLTANSIPWSQLLWSSKADGSPYQSGRLDRFYCSSVVA